MYLHLINTPLEHVYIHMYELDVDTCDTSLSLKKITVPTKIIKNDHQQQCPLSTH